MYQEARCTEQGQSIPSRYPMYSLPSPPPSQARTRRLVQLPLQERHCVQGLRLRVQPMRLRMRFRPLRPGVSALRHAMRASCAHRLNLHTQSCARIRIEKRATGLCCLHKLRQHQGHGRRRD